MALGRWPSLRDLVRPSNNWLTRHAMRVVYRAPAGTRCPPGQLPATNIHHILVCRSISKLGDFLLLTPLLEELETRFPHAEIDLLTRCEVAQQLCSNRPTMGRVRQLPRHIVRHPISATGVLASMRRCRYDLVIDPDPKSQSSRLLALMANAHWSLGFAGPYKSGRMTHVVDSTGCPQHMAKIPVYLLRRALGIETPGSVYPRLNIRLDEAELRGGREALTRLIGNNARRCIGVFASATGAKRLEPRWWERFLDAIVRHAPGCTVVEVLPAAGASQLGAHYPCFHADNLREVAAVLAQFAAVVSTDSGIMHLASATGSPTVGLFRVTDPARWGPYGGSNRVILVAGREPEQVATQVVETLKEVHSA